MRRSKLGVFALLLFVSLEARAAAAPQKKRLAVLDVRVVGTFDPKAVQGLSTFIAAEAERFNFKVIAGSDLAAVVGYEKQRRILGCSDGGCLAEIGGALGADYLLSPEVSEVGGVWLLTVTLIDVPKSQALKRVNRKFRQMGEMVDSAQAATQEILGHFQKSMEPRGEAPKPAVTDNPVRAPSPEFAPHAAPATAAASDANGGSTSATALALDIGGAALIAGGAVAGVLALGQYNAGKTASPTDLPGIKSSGKTEAWIANGLYGVGGAALIVGLVMTFSGSSTTTPAAVSASPIPGGAALSLLGSF